MSALPTVYLKISPHLPNSQAEIRPNWTAVTTLAKVSPGLERAIATRWISLAPHRPDGRPIVYAEEGERSRPSRFTHRSNYMAIGWNP